ncbi:sporulation initiation inhibitor protein Soj [Arthrobacter sp. Hiyo1]|nr:sporulation initiation inhibitor protein Soj [Arthrobacter sp. Hiyo1]
MLPATRGPSAPFSVSLSSATEGTPVMSAKIIAVCNQKGGVGKTTLVTGLAEVFSRVLGLKVLVIDADPQYNVTSAFGINSPEFTLNDVLYGDESNNQKILPGVAADAIMAAGEAWQAKSEKKENFPQLDLIAAERNLASRERDSMMAREHRLRISLKGVTDDYDIILIDCPPSLGLLTVNALTAATHALLVTEPRVASVEGLSEIVTTISEVQENLNEDIELLGVVINKTKKNRPDQLHWIEKVNANFGDLVLEPMIRDAEVFAKAQAAALPMRAYGSEGSDHRADLIQLATVVWKGANAA